MRRNERMKNRKHIGLVVSVLAMIVIPVLLIVSCSDAGTDPFFHTVTLSYDGEDTVVRIVAHGDTFTFPTVQKDGYVLSFWKADESRYTSGDKITVNGDLTAEAVWTKRITVSIDYDDGTDTKSYLTSDGTIILPRLAEREGYVFSGWQVGDRTYSAGEEVAVDGDDISLTALWKKIYTVTVDYSDGRGTEEVRVEGDGWTLPEAPERDNWTFTFWKVGEKEYEEGSEIKLDGDITITALWTENVYVLLDNGEGTKTKSYLTSDGTIILPRVTERDGYDFSGWYVDGVAKNVGEKIDVTDDISITAKWIKTYNVLLDYSDGTAVISVKCTENEYTLPSPSGRTGYIFNGWKVGTIIYPSSSAIHLTEDTTSVTADWTEKKSVTLDYGSGKEKIYIEDGTITLPRVSEREGWLFKNWLVNSVVKYPGDEVDVTEDTEIIAEWERLKSVTIVYEDGKLERSYVKSGTEFTLPVDPKRNGFTFIEWIVSYGKVVEETKAKGDVITVTSDTTATAYWEKNSYWIVTLDYDIDGVLPVETRIQKGKKYTIPSYTPTQAGDIFSYWMIDGVEQTQGTEIDVDSDLTVTAKWQKKTYVTVKFDTDGGGTITDQILREGDRVVINRNPSKKGYTFTGWIRDMGSYSVPFDPDCDTVRYDMTLRAQYRADTYTVTFKDGYSDTTLFSLNVVYGEKMNGASVPTRKGYKFLYWKTEDGSRWDISSDYLRESGITLYAVWERNSYTIKFDSNGGTEVEEQTKFFGDSVEEPLEPTRDGYTFKGWTYGASDYDFSSPVESNMTLTAKWDINWYKVTYDGNGGTVMAVESSVEYLNTVSKPQDPVRDGYVFKTWLGSDGSEYDFSTPVTGDITLTASWNPQVYFKSGDTVLKIVEVETDSAVSKPDNLTPQKECYIFREWTLNGSTYNFTTPVTEHIELVAAFNPTVLELTLKFPKDVINVDTIEVSCEKQSVSFSFQDGAANGDYLEFSSSAITALKECDHTITVTPKKSGKNVGSSFTYTVTIKGEKTPYTATVETSSVVDITPTITGESSIDSSYNKYVIPKISTKGGTVRYAIGDEEVTSASDVYPSAGVKLSVDKTIKVLVGTTTIQLEKGETTVQKAWSELFEALGARGPAGGYIFYERSSSDDEECEYWKKDSDGNWTKTSYTWNYMEVAPKELGEYIFGYVFGKDGKIATINSLESIDYARKKSTSVVKQYGDTPYADRKGTKTTTQYAAKACYDYSTTVDGVTYNDWYLPCVYQLNIIAKKIYPKGLIAFADGYYWTTSNDQRVIDDGESDALSNVIYIRTDEIYSFMWSYKAHVIPVRSF